MPEWQQRLVGQFSIHEGREAVKGFQLNILRELRLRKNNLLRKGWEYERVYKKGKRLHSESFSLICEPNLTDQSRLGISVHRKIRGAVKRNRIKRLIRESFRLYREQYPVSMDIVFTVRPGFSLSRPMEITTAVASIVARTKNS